MSLSKALSAILGPARRREPTRLCPTLATDDRQPPALPDVMDFDPPLMVRLADLRKARPLNTAMPKGSMDASTKTALALRYSPEHGEPLVE